MAVKAQKCEALAWPLVLEFELPAEPVPVEVVPPAPRDEPRPLRVAYFLSMAHVARQMLQDGEIECRVDLAAALGCSPARLSQIFDLLLLAPPIQEELLAWRQTTFREEITERSLRPLVRHLDWATQVGLWERLRVFGQR